MRPLSRQSATETIMKNIPTFIIHHENQTSHNSLKIKIALITRSF
jgi:hypothetical protein